MVYESIPTWSSAAAPSFLLPRMWVVARPGIQILYNVAPAAHRVIDVSPHIYVPTNNFMYYKRLSQAEINGCKGRSPQVVIAASELHALRLTEAAGCHGRGEERPMAPAPGP